MTMDTRKKHPFDDIWRRKRPNGGASWAGWNPPPEPEPENIPKDEWPIPKERTDLVFAKCCTPEHWGSTHAGSDPMPASDFGKVMLAGSMLVPSAAEAAGLALGFDAVLGRVAGGGIMQKGFTWALRGNPAGVFVLGMLPTKMGDGTLYTDDQLRSMTRAPTHVRFQFRRDAEGALQVYGIHTGPSGDDTFRTVQAQWNTSKTAIEAELNGVTILWTPRGRSGIPPMVHPDANNSQGTILVHPIPALSKVVDISENAGKTARDEFMNGITRMAGLSSTTNKASIWESSTLTRANEQRTPSQAEPRQSNFDRSQKNAA